MGHPAAAVNCAIEISRELPNYAELKLRMGAHTGPVRRDEDINDEIDAAGGGINLAQRVMDAGDAGHILISKAVAENLEQLGDWAQYLHDLGEIEVKHGVRIHIFNLHSHDFGKPERPTRPHYMAETSPPSAALASSASQQNLRLAHIGEIAQRAYVVAKIRDVGERDNTLQFRLRIENAGNTPANDVIVLYAYGLREKPPHDEAPGEPVVYDLGFTETERLGLVAPNACYHVISTPEISFQSPAEYQRFESGQLSFYCWGRIVYETIFNEGRHTDFCFVQSPRQPHVYLCKHGNQAI